MATARSLGAVKRPNGGLERPTVQDVNPEQMSIKPTDVPSEPTAETGKRRGKERTKGGPSDAAFGVKTRKDGKREWYYGYELHAIVRAPDDPGANGVRPEAALVERIRLTPAGTDVVDPSLEMIDSVRVTGQGIRYLLTDRHYSFKKFVRWLSELLVRCIRQVVDLRDDYQGFRVWDGALIAAGWPHCPGTPANLGKITNYFDLKKSGGEASRERVPEAK